MILNKLRQIKHDKNLLNVISNSSLFDEEYYSRRYRLDKGIAPLDHFVKFGLARKHNPSESFDTDYYLESNPDVAAAKIHPFIHYILHGQHEGRQAKPDVTEEVILPFASDFLLPNSASSICRCKNEGLFCGEVYKQSYSDLSGIERGKELEHFVNFGLKEFRYRSLSDKFVKYKNNYGEEFTKSLLNNDSLINFMRDKAVEEDIGLFLNLLFQPCNTIKSTYCFDIFDTLIYREVVNPEEIFSLVELKSEHWGFTTKRIEAENKCKEKFGSKQYLMTDIYQAIDVEDDQRTALYELEIEIERENIKLRKSVFDFLLQLESYGHEVKLISDFHLTKDELLTILPTEFHQYRDRMVVSGDYKTCKHSGDLYKDLFENNWLDSEQINVMIGDNYHSDYLKSIESGFDNSIRIPTINETVLRKYVDFVFSFDLIMRKKLKVEAVNKRDVTPVVLATTMVYLCKYINVISELKNNRNIFVLGRDGYLLKESIKVLKGQNIAEISNSRTLNFNSIIENYDDIDECMSRDGNGTTIGDKLFSRLGYRLNSQLSSYPEQYIYANTSAKEAVYKKLIEHCVEQRALYRDYIASAHDVKDGNEYIAFDIGYRGTSARAFEKILPNSEISWIYYATFPGQIKKHQYDAVVNSIDLEQYGEILPILESLFSDQTLGSAHYFEDNKLVRKTASVNHELKNLVCCIQDMAIDVLQSYKSEGGMFLNLEYGSSDSLLKYLKKPDISIVDQFVGISDEDSFANATSCFISKDLGYESSSWKSALKVKLNSINGVF